MLINRMASVSSRDSGKGGLFLLKPPDGGGGNSTSFFVSFHDKVMGDKETPPPIEKRDLLEANLVRMEFVNGNRLKPMVYLDKSVVKELSVPYKDALVVKLLGKKIDFMTMRDHLKAIWCSIGGFELVDIGHKFFMVNFDTEVDHTKVIEEKGRTLDDLRSLFGGANLDY